MKLTRMRVWLICLLVLLGILALAASARKQAAKDRAVQAQADVAAVAGVLQEIDRLKNRPSLAGAQEIQLSELARQIEQSAVAAGVLQANIIRIYPDPDRRLGESPYVEKPTQLMVKNVTMQQATTLCLTLKQKIPGLWVKSLRLSAPRGGEGGDDWSVESVLSYLVYAPNAATPAAREP